MGIHKFPTGKLKTKMSNLNPQSTKNQRGSKKYISRKFKGKRNSVWIQDMENMWVGVRDLGLLELQLGKQCGEILKQAFFILPLSFLFILSSNHPTTVDLSVSKPLYFCNTCALKSELPTSPDKPSPHSPPVTCHTLIAPKRTNNSMQQNNVSLKSPLQF